MKSMNMQSILSVLRHSSRWWFYLAALQCVLGAILYWVIQQYFSLNHAQSESIVRYGITEEVLHPIMAWTCLLLLFALVFHSTRSIAKEREQGTWILYLTAPLNGLQIVLKKFMNTFGFFSLLLIGLFLAPLLLAFYEQLDWGQLGVSFIGILLFFSSIIAMGLLCSAWLSPLNALVACTGLVLGMILLEWGAEYLGNVGYIVKQIALLYPLKHFLSGWLVLHDILYYLVLTVMCLSLAALRIELEPKFIR